MSYIIDIRGPQGNAFVIMGIVENRMKQDGASPEPIKAVMDDMKSGDYEHLLDVAEEHVTLIGR